MTREKMCRRIIWSILTGLFLLPLSLEARTVTFLGKFGGDVISSGTLKEIIALSKDTAGNIYVATHDGFIHKFDRTGKFLARWGGQTGNGDGQFGSSYGQVKISGLAVDREDNVYVADAVNFRIQKFTNNGTFVLKVGAGPGTGDAQFNYWLGRLVVDSKNNIYVADSGNHRIQKFDKNGAFLGWWGKDDQRKIGWHNPGSGRTGTSGNPALENGAFNSPTVIGIDSSENLFVASGGGVIQKFATNPAINYVTKFGGYGIDNGTFNGGFIGGIGVDADGNVYASDTRSHRVQIFNKDYTYKSQLGIRELPGYADGQFYEPTDVVVIEKMIYVADKNCRIQQFTAMGDFACKFGSDLSSEGKFNSPQGVAIDSKDNIYVADQGNWRIHKLAKDGGYLGQWGSFGSGVGSFEHLTNIGIGPDMKKIYTTETWDLGYYNIGQANRIQKFTGLGTPLDSWGGPGQGDGQFGGFGPSGIAFDSEENIYVTDTGNHRVVKFATDKTLLGWWGKDDQGKIGWHNPGSGRTGIAGDEDGAHNWPISVSVDKDNNIYVAERGSSRIQKYTIKGQFLMKFGGTQGSSEGQIDSPEGVDIDHDGNVYVADSGNNRVQIFTATGEFLNSWGGYGTDDGKFHYPTRIAIDSQMNIYVTDFYNHRIQKFRLTN